MEVGEYVLGKILEICRNKALDNRGYNAPTQVCTFPHVELIKLFFKKLRPQKEFIDNGNNGSFCII